MAPVTEPGYGIEITQNITHLLSQILWILAVTIATVTHLWQSSFALLTTPLWKDLVDDLPVLPLPEDSSSPEDHHDKRSICTMSSCGGTKNVTLYKEVREADCCAIR